MNEPTIRHIHGEEMLNALFELNQYSLHSSPPFQNKDDWTAQVRERKGVTCFAAFVGDKPVSVAASTAMTQNLREILYPASGVWGVSTHPSVRRQGCCRRVMAEMLRSERESGKVFTNLYPFRESFYERLGFVAFPLTKVAKIAPESLSPCLKMETGGEIDLQLIGPAYSIYRSYLAELRQKKHGVAFFDQGDQSGANRNNLWLAQAKFGDHLEGLMLYRISGEEVTKFNFVAYRFYYHTSRARYLMLNWIARHVDQADRAEIWVSPDELPEAWLSDLQVKVESAIRPAMIRVLDVEKIAGMQVGPGSFCVEISDPLCPWNEGMWQFSSQEGRLTVSRGSSEDCTLSIQGLSALIAGVGDPQDYAFRGWGNPDNALQSAMRAMFPAMNPFLHENF
jgi:predicted acetyltransferase